MAVAAVRVAPPADGIIEAAQAYRPRQPSAIAQRFEPLGDSWWTELCCTRPSEVYPSVDRYDRVPRKLAPTLAMQRAKERDRARVPDRERHERGAVTAGLLERDALAEADPVLRKLSRDAPEPEAAEAPGGKKKSAVRLALAWNEETEARRSTVASQHFQEAPRKTLTRLEKLDQLRIEKDKKKMSVRDSGKLKSERSESFNERPLSSRQSVPRQSSASVINRASVRTSSVDAVTPTKSSSRPTVTGSEVRVRSMTPDSIASKSSVDSGVFMLMELEPTEADKRMTQKFSMVQQKGEFEVELSDKDKRLRELTTKMDLNLVDVEAIEREFHRYDEDGSGEIEFPEFKSLLCELLKAKPDDFPERRMNQLWSEIDADKSGCVDFEEFLDWYQKYFMDGGSSIQGNPMEQFYAGFGQNRMSTARRQTAGVGH